MIILFKYLKKTELSFLSPTVKFELPRRPIVKINKCKKVNVTLNLFFGYPYRTWFGDINVCDPNFSRNISHFKHTRRRFQWGILKETVSFQAY